MALEPMCEVLVAGKSRCGHYADFYVHVVKKYACLDHIGEAIGEIQSYILLEPASARRFGEDMQTQIDQQMKS